jgi:hypothetical protein
MSFSRLTGSLFVGKFSLVQRHYHIVSARLLHRLHLNVSLSIFPHSVLVASCDYTGHVLAKLLQRDDLAAGTPTASHTRRPGVQSRDRVYDWNFNCGLFSHTKEVLWSRAFVESKNGAFCFLQLVNWRTRKGTKIKRTDLTRRGTSFREFSFKNDEKRRSRERIEQF